MQGFATFIILKSYIVVLFHFNQSILIGPFPTFVWIMYEGGVVILALFVTTRLRSSAERSSNVVVSSVFWALSLRLDVFGIENAS